MSHRSLCRIASAAAALLAVTSSAVADSVTLAPSKDNTLIEPTTMGDVSNALGDLFSGRTGAMGGIARLRAVLRFDVASNVPAGSTITAASLTLVVLQTGPAGNQTHTLHRLSADWGEGTSSGFGGGGAPATPGDATWNHRFFPGPADINGDDSVDVNDLLLLIGAWGSTGGPADINDDGPVDVNDLLLLIGAWGPAQVWTAGGGDFNGTESASQTVGSSGSVTWSSATMVADLQGWLDDPEMNFGWVLIGNEGAPGSAKKFGSKETKPPANRPALLIEFTPPPP